MTTQAQSNSQAVLNDAIAKSREFGETAGAGAVSKVGWYFYIGEQAKNGGIDKTNAEVLFDAFFDGQQKRMGSARAAKGKDRGVRISEARRIIVCCGLPNINGLKVLDTAMRVIRDNASIKGEIDDKLLKIARVQCSQPDKPLTQDEIKQHLQPPAKEDKSEADRLGLVRNSLFKVAKDCGWNPHTRAAFSSLNARIEQLGGTTQEKKVAERKKKQEAAKGKKKV